MQLGGPAAGPAARGGGGGPGALARVGPGARRGARGGAGGECARERRVEGAGLVGAAVGLARRLDPQERVYVGVAGVRGGRQAERPAGRVTPGVAGADAVAAGVDHQVQAGVGDVGENLLAVVQLVVRPLKVGHVGEHAVGIGRDAGGFQRGGLLRGRVPVGVTAVEVDLGLRVVGVDNVAGEGDGAISRARVRAGRPASRAPRSRSRWRCRVRRRSQRSRSRSSRWSARRRPTRRRSRGSGCHRRPGRAPGPWPPRLR